MRALEKSAEVIVAKKPGNAGGVKDRRSRPDRIVDSVSSDATNSENGVLGGVPGPPGTEGPWVVSVKPEGRRSSPSGGGSRKERPGTLCGHKVAFLSYYKLLL